MELKSQWEFSQASECRRGLMCGMGYSEEEQKRPRIAVVNSWNEYNPGHQQELTESGVSPTQFISINFEDMSYSHLQTAQALHDEITKRATEIEGRVYLFFDEIQEVKDWEKCINSFRVSLDCDIYITGSNAKLLSGELATYLGGRYVEFVIYPFSFGEFMELYRLVAPDASIQQCFV